MHINVFRITADRRAFSTRSVFRTLKPLKGRKLEEENIKCGIFYNDEVKDQFE